MKPSKLLFATLISGLLITACGSSGSKGDTSDSGEIVEEIPEIDTAKGVVKYGIFPQTVVTDGATITALDKLDSDKKGEKNGWYLLDDTYYAKVNNAKTFVNTPDYVEGEEVDEKTEAKYYHFNNNQRIVTDHKYWFKCEPIIWKMLKTDEDGAIHLITEEILDARPFHTSTNPKKIGKDDSGKDIYAYPNNYEYAAIRTYLTSNSNSDFLKTAFSQGHKYAQVTTVDNNEKTTGVPEGVANPYACNDTNDKFYILSHADLTNTDLGQFTADVNPNRDRTAVLTDYAKARGAFYSQDETHQDSLNRGCYWTRSPYYEYNNMAYYVAADGSIRNDINDEGITDEDALEKQDYDTSKIDSTRIGFRPAMTLKMN